MIRNIIGLPNFNDPDGEAADLQYHRKAKPGKFVAWISKEVGDLDTLQIGQIQSVKDQELGRIIELQLYRVSDDNFFHACPVLKRESDSPLVALSIRNIVSLVNVQTAGMDDSFGSLLFLTYFYILQSSVAKISLF